MWRFHFPLWARRKRLPASVSGALPQLQHCRGSWNIANVHHISKQGQAGAV